MELRKITDPHLEIKDYIWRTWYFEKVWEKIFIVVLCTLGVFFIVDKLGLLGWIY